MTQTVTRALLLTCVLLQLLVIASSAYGIDHILRFFTGPMAPEERLLLARVNIVLMVAGSICTLAVGLWLAWALFSVRRHDDDGGRRIAATGRRSGRYAISTLESASPTSGTIPASGSHVVH